MQAFRERLAGTDGSEFVAPAETSPRTEADPTSAPAPAPGPATGDPIPTRPHVHPHA